MSAGDSASPTEEELEAMLAHVESEGEYGRIFRHHSDLKWLIAALRSARESARVATRERDEFENEARVFEAQAIENFTMVKDREAQLTDRDRMIAGLQEKLSKLVKECRAFLANDPEGREFRLITGHTNFKCFVHHVEEGEQALSTSHPIAAAYEASIAQERDAWVSIAHDVMVTLVGAVGETVVKAVASQLHAHEETIGRLSRILERFKNRPHAPQCEQWRVLGDPIGSVTLGDGKIESTGRPWKCFCGKADLDDALAAAPPGEYEQRVRREALEACAKYIENYARDVEPVTEDEARYVHPRLAAAIRALGSNQSRGGC